MTTKSNKLFVQWEAHSLSGPVRPLESESLLRLTLTSGEYKFQLDANFTANPIGDRRAGADCLRGGLLRDDYAGGRDAMLQVHAVLEFVRP